MRIRNAAFLVAVVFAVAVPATPVAADGADATPVAVSGPAAKFWGYATPAVIVEKGGDLTYSNVDFERHDFVHDVESDGFGTHKKMPWCKKAKGADGHHHDHGAGCPVFWSKQIGLGETTEVLGLENLEPGTIYTFFCTLHHGMKGTLIAR